VRLTGAALAGQLVSMAVAPVLSRLYGPAEFGLLAVFFALLALCSAVGTLRYEMAIPLARTRRRATALVLLALIASSVVAVVVALLIDPLSSLIANLTGTPALGSLLWLLPLGIVGAGVHATLTYWTVRTQAYGALGRSRLVQPLSSAIVQLGGGAAGLGAFGLIAGQAVSRLIAGIGIGAEVRPRLRPPTSRRRVLHLLGTARQFRRFPALTMPATIINTASLQLPVLMLAVAFGPLVTGYLALTLRVLQLPMAIVSQSVGQVFLGTLGRNRSALPRLTRETFEVLLAVSVAPYLLLAIVGPMLFVDVFGSEWREAGEYVVWLAPWLLASFVGQPIASVAYLTNRQGSEVVFQVLLLASRIGGVAIGAIAGEPLLSIQLIGLSGGVIWAAYTGWLIRASGSSLGQILGIVAREGAVSAGIGLPLMGAIIIGLPSLATYGVTAVCLLLAIAWGWRRLRRSLPRGGLRHIRG